MFVRFRCATAGVDVAYGFGDARVPCRGETIVADGSDPEFPQGVYRVQSVVWDISIREHHATCLLEQMD